MATMVWLFPLFPAEPKLGPVYQQITHFIPLEFPLLMIVPAIAIDLRALAAWPKWLLAPVLGVAFVALLVAVEWPFATFLQSRPRATRSSAADYFAYFMQPGLVSRRATGSSRARAGPGPRRSRRGRDRHDLDRPAARRSAMRAVRR